MDLEFGVQFGEFDVEGFDVGVCLFVWRRVSGGWKGGKECLRGGWGSGCTFEMALLRVGLGPVLLAPKRRFMTAIGRRESLVGGGILKQAGLRNVLIFQRSSECLVIVFWE